MRKTVVLMFALFWISGYCLAQKEVGVKDRCKEYMDIRNSVSEDKPAEVERIKGYLASIEGKDLDSLSTYQYNIWRSELEKFGEEKNKVLSVQYIDDKTIAIVKTQIFRKYQIKKSNGKSRPEVIIYKKNLTWEKKDDVWYLRTVNNL